MIREIEVRLLVQNKPNSFGFTNIYSPAVLSFRTMDELPFCIPTADIQIISNSGLGTDTYVSPVHADDIVRLQVCERIDPNTAKVWQEIFSGRIREISANYGNQNTTRLFCVGHMEEAEWTSIEETKAYTTPTDSRAIIQYFLSRYHRMLEYSDTYCQPGLAIPAYDTTADQTCLADIFCELEKISTDTWFADAIPTYTTGGLLEHVYLSWKPLTDIVTDEYKVRENTERFLSSDFSSTIEDLVNASKVYGDNPPDTSTAAGTAVTENAAYVGTYSDSSSITIYGRRFKCETYTWVKSNTQATALATGTVVSSSVATGSISSIIAGTATLVGTPRAHKGDLVEVKLRSTEVNGFVVVANFTVCRVEHSFSGNEFTTRLDFKKVVKTPYDYIKKIVKDVKTLKKNLNKG